MDKRIYNFYFQDLLALSIIATSLSDAEAKAMPVFMDIFGRYDVDRRNPDTAPQEFQSSITRVEVLHPRGIAQGGI
jgi:hypothetical protein